MVSAPVGVGVGVGSAAQPLGLVRKTCGSAQGHGAAGGAVGSHGAVHGVHHELRQRGGLAALHPLQLLGRVGLWIPARLGRRGAVHLLPLGTTRPGGAVSDAMDVLNTALTLGVNTVFSFSYTGATSGWSRREKARTGRA